MGRDGIFVSSRIQGLRRTTKKSGGTKMRKSIELNYVKKNGMLYPDLQISNNIADDKQPIGKYGMMWLKFMFEWHYDRYIELRMSGKLLSLSHKINDEGYALVKAQIRNDSALKD